MQIFTIGQIVKCRFGKKHVVMSVNGCDVLTTKGDHFHPTKLFAV